MLRKRIQDSLTVAQMRRLQEVILLDGGVSRSSYQRFLAGQSNNLKVAAELCKHLGCSLTELLDPAYSFTGKLSDVIVSDKTKTSQTLNPETV